MLFYFVEVVGDDDVVIMDEECEGYMIVCVIVVCSMVVECIIMCDVKSYCVVLCDDNNCRFICCLYFNLVIIKNFGFFSVDKIEIKVCIDILSDIYKYVDVIEVVIQFYLQIIFQIIFFL